MDPSTFSNPSGTLVSTIQGQKAFIPIALPPQIDLTSIQQTLSEADQKSESFAGSVAILPIHICLYAHCSGKKKRSPHQISKGHIHLFLSC